MQVPKVGRWARTPLLSVHPAEESARGKCPAPRAPSPLSCSPQTVGIACCLPERYSGRLQSARHLQAKEFAFFSSFFILRFRGSCAIPPLFSFFARRAACSGNDSRAVGLVCGLVFRDGGMFPSPRPPGLLHQPLHPIPSLGGQSAHGSIDGRNWSPASVGRRGLGQLTSVPRGSPSREQISGPWTPAILSLRPVVCLRGALRLCGRAGR